MIGVAARRRRRYWSLTDLISPLGDDLDHKCRELINKTASAKVSKDLRCAASVLGEFRKTVPAPNVVQKLLTLLAPKT